MIKKIALFHPYLVTRGGSQRYCLETAKQLISRKYEVSVYTIFYNPTVCYPELCDGLQITSVETQNNVIATPKKIPYLLDSLGLVHIFRRIRIKRKIQKIKCDTTYDLLYVHESGNHNSIKNIIKAKKNWIFVYDVPLKLVSWGKDKGDSKIKCFLNAVMVRLVYKKNDVKGFDNIFALDKVAKQECDAYYDVKTTIINGGIDIFRFSPAVGVEGGRVKRDARVKIVMVTRIAAYRNVLDVIVAIRQLPNVCLYINGPVENLEYMKDIEDYIAKYKMQDRVEIDCVPFVNDNELVKTINSADVCVFPNSHQTWGNFALESMSCAKTTIISDQCGISSIATNKENALIYTCNDVSKLKECIDYASDPIKSSEIGLKAREYVCENLTWEKWIDNHMQHM